MYGILPSIHFSFQIRDEKAVEASLNALASTIRSLDVNR